jgi:hypothetical protein
MTEQVMQNNIEALWFGFTILTLMVCVFATKVICREKPPLTPGECECGHGRCFHKNGRDACTVEWTINGTENRGVCACEVFIPDQVADKELQALRSMTGIK